jgi:hypothetical protein
MDGLSPTHHYAVRSPASSRGTEQKALKSSAKADHCMEQLRPFGSLFVFLVHLRVVGWICWVGMHARLIRYQEAGDNHFITLSCYRRAAYFPSIASRNLFEAALERMQRRYGSLSSATL